MQKLTPAKCVNEAERIYRIPNGRDPGLVFVGDYLIDSRHVLRNEIDGTFKLRVDLEGEVKVLVSAYQAPVSAGDWNINHPSLLIHPELVQESSASRARLADEPCPL